VSFTVVSITATADTTAQNLTVGTAMASFTPLTASGGVTPYTFSYTGTLPSGLSFDTSTGAVTGTPDATYITADLVFSVQDANSVVASTTSTVSFTVAPWALLWLGYIIGYPNFVYQVNSATGAVLNQYAILGGSTSWPLAQDNRGKTFKKT
jgi:hypothetical protein